MNKYKFDERRKELIHTIVEDVPLFGKEKYGKVNKVTKIISNEIGTTRVLMYLEQQKEVIESEVQKAKDNLKEKEENLSAVKKDIKSIKDIVGSRINFKKVGDKIQKELKKEAKK